MVAEAAGRYRRSRAERDDQQLSWNRSDQAFFASGACHVLAWTCREVNRAFEGRPLQRVEITANLRAFCAEHHHRMPDKYWADPLPRARAYAAAFKPPWKPGC